VHVLVYPADQAGCGKYRLIWIAEALQAQGHDITIMWPSERAGISGGVLPDGTCAAVEAPEADVIVMQRLSFRPIATAVPLLRAKGIAVVVDMDDDLSAIHPKHSAYLKYQPGTGGMHTWENAAYACRMATMVTTSTPALQKVYASHGRGAVLRNCVPARYLDVPRVDSDVIGWPGSVPSHPNDLQQVGNAVRRLVSQGHKFKGVGPVYGLRQALDLDAIPDATGNVSLDEWPNAVGSLGVGMVPLEDSPFNASKSFLKGLELAATGVPFVASPRDEYRHLHKLGTGILAAKPQHWYSALRSLATNPALRQEMSEAGRAVAAERTIEANAWRWLEVWKTAYDTQRHAARSGATGLVRT
jgi:glycosyltransferase involved in cell wall biosynthesis